MSSINEPKKLYGYGDQRGNQSIVKTVLVGQSLLDRPILNKGSAFTKNERDLFYLNSLLPYQVNTMEEQLERVGEQYDSFDSDIQKSSFLQGIHDQNEVLFFRFVLENLVKVLPVVYTPTEGEYIEKYSHLFRRPRGVFVNFPEKKHTQKMIIEGALQNSVATEDVDLIVVTDSEEILGIGDQGVGGSGISIAKLTLYTVMAGVNPARVLPIVLDVGTNNQALLDDPLYLGWRHRRVQGQEYYDFVDSFVETVRGKFQNAFLHWEDFGRHHARALLEKYQPKMATFNDDVQGTGAITLALILAALRLKNEALADQRIVIFGAGSAGIGIADNIHRYLIQRVGLSEKDALDRLWCIDKDGLLMDDGSTISDMQRKYVRSSDDIKTWTLENSQQPPQLINVTENIKPTILVGVSTCAGAFTENIIQTMAANCDVPIIFPLSNPTRLAEATPHDLIQWTKGKGIVATGSPFEPVTYENKTYEITECNNAFVYPGIGLGCIVSKAKHCTDDMIFSAADTISHCSPAFQTQDPTKSLLPDIQSIRQVCKKVAVAVAKQALVSGESKLDKSINPDDLDELVSSSMWYPRYPSYELVDSL